MTDEPQDTGAQPGGNALRYVLLSAAVVYVIISLYLLFDMRGRVETLESGEKQAKADNAQLLKRLGITEASLRNAAETQEELAQKLGSTQKEVVSRTAQLQKQQKEAEQRITQQTEQKVGAVSGEVAGVKTELGGAKTDIATTKSDLEATKSKLERALGDLGMQSGLIARTREDLEYLKHRGDRNIFEFTLNKGAKPTPVGTISLQLKKVDAKKSRFTLNVLSDDRTIEKKEKTLFEPLQFLSGRDRMLYEVVVLSADKNKISGYLSTPKNAPMPTPTTPQ
jgi:hypothetical protein